VARPRPLRVRTARVYDPPTPGEGSRVLVMRLWPRGIRRAHVDRWLPDLGPSRPLLRAYRSGRVSWAAFRRQYLRELRAPGAQAALAELRALRRRGPVTLLCGCPDPARCHRTVLQRALARGVV
jgi:uncharacterized protein YeaO (DUF488 family)